MCFELARQALAADEVPVGAVIVKQGNIIAKAHNLVYTTSDPTAHAEIVAIREASRILNSPMLLDCDLYVSLEPCTLCAAAISFARIRRLYFCAYDPKGGGVDHNTRFFDQPSCFHKPQAFGGFRAKESEDLLKTFFEEKRR